MSPPGKWLYGATIFLSSFLLFLIQPIIAKRILPWFGGSTAVWTTCLLFFQLFLLVGYLYAHLLVTRFPLRVQVVIHCVLLLGSLLLLPVTPGAEWKPSGSEDPLARILLLLGATIGLPYLLLSTTSPLVQSWYAQSTAAGADQPLPYRLFALSNLASMLSLLGYPFLIEPRVATTRQLLVWSLGYAAFVALCCTVAFRSRHAVQTRAATWERICWSEQLTWLALAACGSALLLAATNHLSQNVAAIPFLWVLPLSLYLLTFIIAFDHENCYVPLAGVVFSGLALYGMAYCLTAIPNRYSVRLGIPVYSAGLFCTCLFCHAELARRKPSAQQLTSFYLMLSLGGAIGALFAGLFAPRAFSGFYEFPLAMIGCAAMGLALYWRARLMVRLYCAAVLIAVVALSARDISRVHRESRLMVRNFYGGLRVGDVDAEAGWIRELVHGTINHGMQFLDAERRDRPITYYGPDTGVGLAIRGKQAERPSGIRVGVVGLGTGTLAAYGRQGDVFRFYEINPLVLGIARTWFTFLKDSHAQIEVILGDARLALERERPQKFDVLAVDAFSSDSIPVHLLTREALRIYLAQLAPEGILALHISNANLNLRPVTERLAASVGKQALLVLTYRDESSETYSTDWVLIPRVSLKTDDPLRRKALVLGEKLGFRPWTDDFSNLFQVWK